MPQKSDFVKLRAFAKLNLSLKITGKRPDGFHEIDSIMQSISLHDEVEIAPSAGGITVHCSAAEIKDNTAIKAAELILSEAKRTAGVNIHIKKNIPLASGMAGGSADAAATLIGMNKLFGLNLHIEKLIELGGKIGSDVPFCMVGGTARCTGRGEKILRLNPHSGAAFILVFPDLALPTKLVYDKFDIVGPGKNGNDLEKAAFELFPVISELKCELESETGRTWKMSGSGPTLFMELDGLADSEKHLEVLSGMNLRYQVSKRMDSGVEFI